MVGFVPAFKVDETLVFTVFRPPVIVALFNGRPVEIFGDCSPFATPKDPELGPKDDEDDVDAEIRFRDPIPGEVDGEADTDGGASKNDVPKTDVAKSILSVDANTLRVSVYCLFCEC